jgi:hypothetical protein
MDTTFDNLWTKVLKPQGEYIYRERACRRLWDTFNPAKQLEIYDRIEGKKQRCEFVNPNPYFAIVNNVGDTTPVYNPPTNYFGKTLARGVNYFLATFNGIKGLWTEEDVKRYNMSNPQKFEL